MSETSDLTGPLLRQLNDSGGMAMRMPVGRLRKGPHWIQMHEEGTADILFFPRAYDKIAQLKDGILLWTVDFAHPVWIETKNPQGTTAKKRKAAQAAFREKVEALGHRYIMARTIDEGLDALR
jgi:hypothetical protein